jgi:hypothetical protein
MPSKTENGGIKKTYKGEELNNASKLPNQNVYA